MYHPLIQISIKGYLCFHLLCFNHSFIPFLVQFYPLFSRGSNPRFSCFTPQDNFLVSYSGDFIRTIQRRIIKNYSGIKVIRNNWLILTLDLMDAFYHCKLNLTSDKVNELYLYQLKLNLDATDAFCFH